MTTLPRMVACLPGIGEYAELCGISQTLAVRPLQGLDGHLPVDHRRDDLAVLRLRLLRTTTTSPSLIAALIMESPWTQDF